MMGLEDYQRKRDFERTTEPKGEAAQAAGNRFVVHEHHASRLHFDLRLEMDGVLKSWAIPKGPSMNPADKRLAVMVEDHPLDYIDFRGEIAEGNYGAGEVEIWDSGTYEVTEGGLDKGKMVFEISGTRLHGRFSLVRLKSGKDWLLIKGNDEFADPNWKLEQILPGGSRKERKEIESRDQRPPEASAKGPPDTSVDADPMPEAISPMLASLVDKPFSDPQWLYEMKWDGYRGISFIKPDSFRFVSRNNQDLIGRFPQTEAIPGLIDAETAILDGEIVVVDENGKPSFQLLQKLGTEPYFRENRALSPISRLVYYVFDLLYLNGQDLRKRPLIERKELLRSIIRPNDFLKYSDHVMTEGEQFFEQVRKMDLEGIVAKRLDSPYLEKRTSLWLKIKNVRRQEIVIGGYTQPRGARSYFGSLVVGVYDKPRFDTAAPLALSSEEQSVSKGDPLSASGEQGLTFAGQVGGGFDEATLREVYDLMQSLRTDQCPFKQVPKTNEPAVWIRPQLVCEVKFAEWTSDGILRQPVFLGMRFDKPPREVVREKPEGLRSVVDEKASGEGPETLRQPQDAPAQHAADAPAQPPQRRVIPVDEAFAREKLSGDICVEVDGIEVSLSNLDKVYYPDGGITKGDLLRYYYRTRDTILPYLKDRPLILRRWPNGIKEESFYQHNLEEGPEWLRRVPIKEEGNTVNYAVIDNAASLLYIVNLGTISQNIFHSRASSLANPDWIVLDLDPEQAPFDNVCEVAMALKGVLDEAGLIGYPKTSGSRGMHVFVPIDEVYTYEQSQNVAEIIANITARRSPKATVERKIAKRGADQVYVDYLQNSLGKTITAPYSVRECPGATVSTPLTWEEVAAKPDKDSFTVASVTDRVAGIGDLFADVLHKKQRLAEAVTRLENMLKQVQNP